MKKIVFAGMLLFGLLLQPAGAEAEMRPKRVLLLRDFDANYRWPTLLSDRILDYYREEPEARAEREASAVPEEREPLAPRIARFQPLCLIPCLYQAKSQSRRHWLRSANVQPNRHAPVRQDPQVSVPCPRSA